MKLTIIQQQVSHFFGIKELVCPHVYPEIPAFPGEEY